MNKITKCITCKKFKFLQEFDRRANYAGIDLNILIGDLECYLYRTCHDCYVRSLILSNAKGRAKAKGLEFNLTLNDIKIPIVCPVLGIPLRRGIGKIIDNSPSIDRINNKRGYTKDNILIISMRANRLKSDASLVELQQIASFYKKYQEK